MGYRVVAMRRDKPGYWDHVMPADTFMGEPAPESNVAFADRWRRSLENDPGGKWDVVAIPEDAGDSHKF